MKDKQNKYTAEERTPGIRIANNDREAHAKPQRRPDEFDVNNEIGIVSPQTDRKLHEERQRRGQQ